MIDPEWESDIQRVLRRPQISKCVIFDVYEKKIASPIRKVNQRDELQTPNHYCRDVLSNDSLLRVILVRYMEGSSPRLSFRSQWIKLSSELMRQYTCVPVKYYDSIYRFGNSKGATNQSGSNIVDPLYVILSKKPWKISPYLTQVGKKLFRNYGRNEGERENSNKVNWQNPK